MSKPYSRQDLSDQFDSDLIWRRRELSDMKAAIKKADAASKSVLLRALITMSYAHWEGYVRVCANAYFEHLTLRNLQYSALERQIYVNSFLVRLDRMNKTRLGVEERCRLVNDILDGTGARFGSMQPDLIDTRSNLSADAIKEICLICGVDGIYFEDKRVFIDIILLRRRNAIAHGQFEYISEADIDDLVANTLALMQHFRSLLENKIYMSTYLAA
jgi:RiboL-PSP-HEPN